MSSSLGIFAYGYKAESISCVHTISDIKGREDSGQSIDFDDTLHVLTTRARSIDGH